MTRNKKFIPRQSKDRLTIEYDREDFETALPHLAAELRGEYTGNIPYREERISKIPIQGIRHEVPDPTIEDFLKRCKSEEEAMEIIEFMRKREEITEEKAQQLITQLKEKGIRSFGSLRKWGYYEREYRRKTVF